MRRVGLSLQSEGDAPPDLHLDADGNLALVYDTEAVGQHVRQRLKTYDGEWFLDTTAGVPWLTEILGRRYDPSLAEAVIKAEILATDAVTEITSFSVRFNDTTRELSAFSISVSTEYDQEVAI